MRKKTYVEVGGTVMEYAAMGKGSRKVVMLPGLSDGLATVGGKTWILSLVYKKYLKDYTVYIFSRKQDMPEGYSIRDMAEDQVLAMDALGIDCADVLGVSQGGMIAQWMAAEHPEKVRKLVLAMTAPSANAEVKETVGTWMEMAQRGDHAALMMDTAERMYTEKYMRKNRSFFPMLAKFTKPRDYDRFIKNAEAILAFDGREACGRIACPTLILAGSEDRTVGNGAASELKDRIPDSELFVYEGLGHGAFQEAQDFYDRVFAFFGKEPA